jgi:hypothetical protein
MRSCSWISGAAGNCETSGSRCELAIAAVTARKQRRIIGKLTRLPGLASLDLFDLNITSHRSRLGSIFADSIPTGRNYACYCYWLIRESSECTQMRLLHMRTHQLTLDLHAMKRYMYTSSVSLLQRFPRRASTFSHVLLLFPPKQNIVKIT